MTGQLFVNSSNPKAVKVKFEAPGWPRLTISTHRSLQNAQARAAACKRSTPLLEKLVAKAWAQAQKGGSK